MSCGKILLCASGWAMVLPSVTASRVLAMASLHDAVGDDLLGDLQGGQHRHAVFSRVESVRANWPKRFNLTTLPKTGAFIRQWSNLALALLGGWKRLNRITTASATTDHQPPVMRRRHG